MSDRFYRASEQEVLHCTWCVWFGGCRNCVSYGRGEPEAKLHSLFGKTVELIYDHNTKQDAFANGRGTWRWKRG